MTETRDSRTGPERARPTKADDRGPGPLGRIALYVRQVIAELRKVVRPTRRQLGTYWLVVLIFVLIVIAIVSVLDLGIGWLMLRVFGAAEG